MTLKEIYDNMDSFTDEERAEIFTKVFTLFSPPSHSTLRDFQNKWDRRKSFEEFVKAQNETIRLCLDMEMSPMGELIRRGAVMTGILPKIDWDYEVKI